MDYFIAVLDFGILAWLICTWFYEGHHRRCTVITECPTCKGRGEVHCSSGDHNHTPDLVKVLERVLILKEAQFERFHFGPYKVRYARDMEEQMGSKYYRFVKSGFLREQTLRDRILLICSIEAVEVDHSLVNGTLVVEEIVK